MGGLAFSQDVGSMLVSSIQNIMSSMEVT